MVTRLDDFLNTPPQELIAELVSLRAAKQALERRETILENVADLIIEAGGDAASELASYRTSVAVGPIRYQIRQVLLAQPEKRVWIPKEVHDELAVRGNMDVSIDNVRVTMRRMVQAGELAKASKSMQYELPGDGGASTNGAPAK
jgi:hypothetical protein